jgi:hypothetical protein
MSVRHKSDKGPQIETWMESRVRRVAGRRVSKFFFDIDAGDDVALGEFIVVDLYAGVEQVDECAGRCASEVAVE